MKHLIVNFIKKKYFFSIIKKIIKRLEKDTSVEAIKWAKSNVKQTTEEFCKSIDVLLYDEVQSDTRLIEKEARENLSKLNISFGGRGNFILLYFLIRKYKLLNIVETGVAAGWSSLAILKALKKNNNGHLYSSDFPYFRLPNPEQFIGIIVPNHFKINWNLFIKGDENNIVEIKKKISSVDLIHYDSDKTYNGRKNFMKLVSDIIHDQTYFVMDDLHDNSFFLDYVSKKKDLNWKILKVKKGFIGFIYPESFNSFLK